MTGTGIAAIARATSSVSKAARSAREPPPRDEHDGVDVELRQLTERPLDPPGRCGALHPDVDQCHLPREPARLQLVHEVVVRRAA